MLVFKELRGSCQQRWVRFRNHCDLLSGLRVCWHGMTDADYHSWRKPITLVITAPSGSLSVEWNALRISLRIPPERFFLCFLCPDPSSWSVNSAVNGALPCLRALSGSDELLLHKAGRPCLLRNGWITSFYLSSIHDKALLLSLL